MSDNKTLKYDELTPEKKAEIDYALAQHDKACLAPPMTPEQIETGKDLLASNPNIIANLPKQYRPR